MTIYLIVVVIALIIGLFINKILVTAPKLKFALYVIFPVAILVLSYLIYAGIQTPIKFEEEKAVRYEKVKQKLIDIRKAQEAYKQIYGGYTADFESLISTMKTMSLPNIRAIGSIPDSLLEKGWNEQQAVSAGLIIRDTVLEPIMGSVFPKEYPINDLALVPYTENLQFELGVGEVVTGSKVKVKVFEAKAPFEWWLKGLNEQLIINLVEQRKLNGQYEGLKVGSLDEANNNAGNWE